MSQIDEDPLVIAARGAGVGDERVLAALGQVPRSRFMPSSGHKEATTDAPISIGAGQTTSQPSLIARILQELDLQPGDRVLEVGAGYGYEAALLAELVAPGGAVVSMERHAPLAQEAASRLLRFQDEQEGLDVQIDVRHGDGMQGAPDLAPFDAIVVAASTPAPPPALLDQLADGGHLVIPVESEGGSLTRLLRFDRQGDQVKVGNDLGFVQYVPLLPDLA